MESRTINVKQYIQGDVFIFAASIPKKAKKISKRPLAFGEVTGHSHTIVEDTVEIYEIAGTLYLHNNAPISVKHEEHKSITIPAGSWQVGIVREYDEFEQAARNVRD